MAKNYSGDDRDELRRVDDLATKDQRDRENYAQRGEGHYAGLQTTGGGHARDRTRILASAGHQSQIDALITNQMASLNSKIATLDDKISQNRQDIAIANDFISDLKNKEAPELNQDGTLKDKERERLLKEYEERKGETVDRTDIDALLVAMLAQKAFEEQQLEVRLAKREGLKEQVADLQQEIDKANEIIDPVKRDDALKAALEGQGVDIYNGVIAQTQEQEDKNTIRSALGREDEAIEKLETSDNHGVGRADHEISVEEISLDLGADFSDIIGSSEPASSHAKKVDGPSFENTTEIKSAFNSNASTNEKPETEQTASYDDDKLTIDHKTLG